MENGKNGDVHSDQQRAEALDQIRRSMHVRDNTLQEPWTESLPELRKFLLGTGPWPPGRIGVTRDAKHVVVRISIPDLDCQADYRGRSMEQCLETANTDLESNSVPWQPGWQTVRKERSKLSGLWGGS